MDILERDRFRKHQAMRFFAGDFGVTHQKEGPKSLTGPGNGGCRILRQEKAALEGVHHVVLFSDHAGVSYDSMPDHASEWLY